MFQIASPSLLARISPSIASIVTLIPPRYIRFYPSVCLLSHRQESTTCTVVRKSSIIEECWNCGKTSDSCFFCKDCEYILPCRKENYFTMMNCPIVFDVDLKSLDATFKSLQKKLHPDKYNFKSGLEQAYSQENCIAVNMAYSTLKEPYSRARYLLKILGEPMSDDERLSSLPFLDEIMQLRIEVDESINNQETLKKLQNENENRINNLIQLISKAFNSNNIREAKDYTDRLQYFIRIRESILEYLDAQ